VQPGQIVAVTADVASLEFMRAITRSAYDRGALFVDAIFYDGVVKRTRLEHADPETLGFVPSWYGGRVLDVGKEHGARISVQPNPEPGVLDGVDPTLAGRDGLPFVPQILTVIDERTTNWNVIPHPTPAWAAVIHPDLPPDEALARLEAEIIHICRLDEPDPKAAWERRGDELEAAAERLNERSFDALHFEGPGTDLTIGLFPTSLWAGARATTIDGILHFANLPTEEVWTAPDPRRADGVVRSTKPLDVEGALVRGLTVRFEGGRAVEIDAETNAEALRGRAAVDEGASRLGEVALVDREGRIGRLDTVFLTTLLDENAASHIALGAAYANSVGEEDRPTVNRSDIHIDFMIGGDDVAVTGITREGDRVPVLRDGAWQI
jgi:aminopeptidase